MVQVADITETNSNEARNVFQLHILESNEVLTETGKFSNNILQVNEQSSQQRRAHELHNLRLQKRFHKFTKVSIHCKFKFLFGEREELCLQ